MSAVQVPTGKTVFSPGPEISTKNRKTRLESHLRKCCLDLNDLESVIFHFGKSCSGRVPLIMEPRMQMALRRGLHI